MASPSVTESSSQTQLSGSVVSSTDLITANSKPKIHFDCDFLKTHPALLKIAEAILCLLGLICVQTIYMATSHSAGGWYYFVAMTGFWLSLFFLASYTYHIAESFQWLPWLATEMAYAALWVLFFFVAASVSAFHANEDPAWGGAAVIGFVAMCIYACEAIQKYRKWQRGDVPQGERQVATVDSNSAANELAD